MLQHEPASRPFQYLVLAESAGGKHLVVVDGNSGWLFVEDAGRHHNTNKVITTLLRTFIKSGFLDLVGQILTLKHIAAIPGTGKCCTVHIHHTMRNQTAEQSAAKSTTKLLRRCWDVRSAIIDEHAWRRGIIQHRNTPDSGERSPAQTAFEKSIRDSLSAHSMNYVTATASSLRLKQCRRDEATIRNPLPRPSRIYCWSLCANAGHPHPSKRCGAVTAAGPVLTLVFGSIMTEKLSSAGVISDQIESD